MFVHFKAEKVAIWEATTSLRMYVESVQMAPRLQQAWCDRNSGNVQWRDIPLVVEPKTPTPTA